MSWSTYTTCTNTLTQRTIVADTTVADNGYNTSEGRNSEHSLQYQIVTMLNYLESKIFFLAVMWDWSITHQTGTLGLFHFQKRTGGGDQNLFGGCLPPQFNFVDPTPYLLNLNSILHSEPPCDTPSSHILNYLIPPTPALQIIFRSSPPR